MDDAKLEEMYQWLIKAKHDLGSAKRLFSGDEPYLDTDVYHCQQGAGREVKDSSGEINKYRMASYNH